MSGPYPIPARPTTYKGVQMRSRLEARVAAWMDEGNLRWQYEPRVYKSRAREYLPDFQVGDRTFIEVKPYIQELADEITTTTILDWAVLHQSVPDAIFWVVYSMGWATRIPQSGDWGAPGLCTAGHLTLIRSWRSRIVTSGSRCPTCERPITWLAEWLDRQGRA